MTNLKLALPDTYETAVVFLGERYSIRVGHNTYLKRDDDKVNLEYHGSVIFSYAPGMVSFSLAGWETRTTKERIHRALSEVFGIRVGLSTKAGRTYLTVLTKHGEYDYAKAHNPFSATWITKPVYHELEVTPYATYYLVETEEGLTVDISRSGGHYKYVDAGHPEYFFNYAF